MLTELSEGEYLADRTNPSPGGEAYLVLGDLKLALEELIPKKAVSVLDFGCGGSPYRELFSGQYDRADIEDNPNRDITLEDASSLPINIGSYDAVLSTQVLEHVPEPDKYLRECNRALRNGGNLILTTHGMFHDHPCPTDFWRWTGSGLEKTIRSAGFTPVRMLQVTNGPRASISMFLDDLDSICAQSKSSGYFLLHLIFRMLRKYGRTRLHKFADIAFQKFRVMDATLDGAPNNYIVIACLAVKTKCLERNSTDAVN